MKIKSAKITCGRLPLKANSLQYKRAAAPRQKTGGCTIQSGEGQERKVRFVTSNTATRELLAGSKFAAWSLSWQ